MEPSGLRAGGITSACGETATLSRIYLDDFKLPRLDIRLQPIEMFAQLPGKLGVLWRHIRSHVILLVPVEQKEERAIFDGQKIGYPSRPLRRVAYAFNNRVAGGNPFAAMFAASATRAERIRISRSDFDNRAPNSCAGIRRERTTAIGQLLPPFPRHRDPIHFGLRRRSHRGGFDRQPVRRNHLHGPERNDPVAVNDADVLPGLCPFEPTGEILARFRDRQSRHKDDMET